MVSWMWIHTAGGVHCSSTGMAWQLGLNCVSLFDTDILNVVSKIILPVSVFDTGKIIS